MVTSGANIRQQPSLHCTVKMSPTPSFLVDCAKDLVTAPSRPQDNEPSLVPRQRGTESPGVSIRRRPAATGQYQAGRRASTRKDHFLAEHLE